MRIVVAVLAVLAVIAGWKFYDGRQVRLARIAQLERECGQSFTIASSKLFDLHRRWDDAEQVARSTARIALPGPLARLQGIRQEVETLDVPRCANEAKAALRTLMRAREQAILTFMNREDARARESLRASNEQLEAYLEAMKAATARHLEVKEELARLRR